MLNKLDDLLQKVLEVSLAAPLSTVVLSVSLLRVGDYKLLRPPLLPLWFFAYCGRLGQTGGVAADSQGNGDAVSLWQAGRDAEIYIVCQS